MKSNRQIVLKSPKLRHLRKSLRQVLKLAVFDKLHALHELFMAESDKDIQKEIIDERSSLIGAFHRYPIACRLCGKVDLDITYYDRLKAWYCDDCYPWVKVKSNY